MKLKMPCKLCEIDHQKLGVSCTHTNNFILPQMGMMPLSLGLQVQNPTILVPQIRDMMLAAYLFRGYYQPAGPLISVPHGHSQQPPLAKSVPLSEPSPTVTPPIIHQPPPPSSAGDSSDSEVIITSVTSAKEINPPLQQQHHQQPPPPQYRYNHYPQTHPAYPYNYAPQYYTAPPPSPAYSHHDICYPPPSPYIQHKYHTYRRYLAPPGPQYYQPSSPDLYNQASPQNTSNQQQVVTATSSASGNNYQPPPNGPPPPTLIETYPSAPPQLVESYPPPAHYYPGYGPAPPPSCYTHQPPTRNLPYINATYQSCPCPMQSCPKNVHTGPLAGDSKRSIAKESVPLPPVALALPLEPASATGPPSPARGSAGMPPPPSPAGATYQPPPPKQETVEPVDIKPGDNRRKARLGKAMVRNTIAANQNTMLLMCHAPHTTHNSYLGSVKREVESPKEGEVDLKKSDLESKVELIRETENSETQQAVMRKETEQHVHCMKVEELEKEVSGEELPPCQKTVAENVKVKNMKRKLSITKETEKVDVVVADKKVKISEKSPNGSYKDLIKKTNTNVVKINNGKRKLIGLINGTKAVSRFYGKFHKIKLKKATRKRKLSPSKEECIKRLKASKPLTASNLHNAKQNAKETKDKSFLDTQLTENKEPTKKSTKKQVNSKVASKTLSEPILERCVFAKNNVDRTIESVISDSCGRTNKPASEPTCVLRTDRCASASKVEPKKEATKLDAKKELVKKSTNTKTIKTKTKVETPTITPSKCGATKRKNSKNINNNNNNNNNKCLEVVPQVVSKIPRRSLQIPRWSNGWIWEGGGFDGKVFLNSDETTVIRKCYPAMRHQDGDIIEPRDCVLLRAGQRKNELPYVAKIAALWENPDDGEMMMSLLWYYRPEHTEQGRLQSDQPDEVFASRHKDSNSVACIDDKCYVLTFNEYCRYRKNLRRLEEGIEDAGPCIPLPDCYPRTNRQPPTTIFTAPDMVFFCRRVYDFRQKRIVKNPS